MPMQTTPPYALAAAGAASIQSAMMSIQQAVPLVQQLHGLQFEEFDRVELQARQATGAAVSSLWNGAEMLGQVVSDQGDLVNRLKVDANNLADATHILAKHDSLPNIRIYEQATQDALTAQVLLNAMATPPPVYPQPYPPQQGYPLPPAAPVA